MGHNLSIDKHTSELDDLLDTPPKIFKKVKFDNKVSPDITQHLKVNLTLPTEP